MSDGRPWAGVPADDPDGDDTMHVVPVNDLIEHDTRRGADCVCGPKVETIRAGFLVTHNSLDGREHAER